MTPRERQFVDYWAEKRKKWSWKRHCSQTFFNVALPVVLIIDLVNYFIIGDTAHAFFTFSHFFVFLLNLVVISALIILASGFAKWNYNEMKYWDILRKNTNKLQ